MTEVWLPFPFTDGKYEVSNYGRVRKTHSKLIKSLQLEKGYCRVTLTLDKERHFFVHGAVMRAFYGEPPKGHQVNHKDCDKTNNRLENLEYVTPKENIQHSIKNGHRAKHFSKEHKKHLGESISKAKKGVPLSEEHKLHLKEGHAKRRNDNE